MTTHEPFRVLLDADTLARAMTRSLLIMAGVKKGSMYRPRWTLRIEAEADRHIATGRVKVAELRMRFDWGSAVLVDDVVEGLEADLAETDAKDRHVLAAARQADIRTIVTGNVRHFGQSDLVRLGIVAVHPDLFLSQVLDPDLYRAVVTEWSSRRTRTGTTPESLHSVLADQHPLTFEAMRHVFPDVEPVAHTNEMPHVKFRGDKCFICGKPLADTECLKLGVCPECKRL